MLALCLCTGSCLPPHASKYGILGNASWSLHRLPMLFLATLNCPPFSPPPRRRSQQAVRLMRQQPAAAEPAYHIFNCGFSKWGAKVGEAACSQARTELARQYRCDTLHLTAACTACAAEGWQLCKAVCCAFHLLLPHTPRAADQVGSHPQGHQAGAEPADGEPGRRAEGGRADLHRRAQPVARQAGVVAGGA